MDFLLQSNNVYILSSQPVVYQIFQFFAHVRVEKIKVRMNAVWIFASALYLLSDKQSGCAIRWHNRSAIPDGSDVV